MIISIVGKTNSGKDSVAKYINDYYGIPMVVSYTTRPKRDYEIDGVQHWFVDKNKMKELMERDDVIAYTKNEETGIEYCAVGGLKKDEHLVYIINPEGIYWFNENNSNIEMYSIYIDTNELDIIERGKNRGDNPIVLQARLNSERDEFNKFRDSHKYDYYVSNNKTIEHLYQEIDGFLYSLGFRKNQK